MRVQIDSLERILYLVRNVQADDKRGSILFEDVEKVVTVRREETSEVLFRDLLTVFRRLKDISLKEENIQGRDESIKVFGDVFVLRTVSGENDGVLEVEKVQRILLES